MSMNAAVYYPHIHPPFKWVILSALCWDKVYLPSAKGEDKFSPIEPWDHRLAPYYAALGSVFDSSLRIYEGLDATTEDEFKSWALARKSELLAGNIHSERQRIFHILTSKFSYGYTYQDRRLLDWLVENGLASIEWPDWLEERNLLAPPSAFEAGLYEEVPKAEVEAVAGSMLGDIYQKKVYKDGKEKWVQQVSSEVGGELLGRDTKIYLPDNIAIYYLSLAAGKLAEKNNADLVTTDSRFTDIITHRTRLLGGQVAASVINLYLPENVSEVQPSQLVDFRERMSAQRLIYQKEIQKLVGDFEVVASEGSYNQLRKDITEVARLRVSQAQAAYRSAKINVALKAATVSLAPPALMSATASMLGIGLVAPVAIAAALSLFSVASFLEIDKARRDKAASPWSYVMDVDRLLS